jgi:serine/threonine protein kinase/tetratricopeptide (TPR) repeat protein
MAIKLKRVKELFLQAVEKADPAARQAFLQEACAGDEELRQQVEALLRQHEQASGYLEPPAVGLPATVDSDPGTGAAASSSPTASAEALGSRIGPYKLLQKLGEGGMGVVYLAEQEHPVKRRVALKIIRAGMDTAHVIARFEQERQALAMMDHPNIAKVLDAGTTGSEHAAQASADQEHLLALRAQSAGRPYFVMELVKGIPITKYCDQEHLTPKERLELFIPVCQAVQHAHQKGIIHRDIKPSNVLVALYDGKPIPKVIDFGVAKATAQKLTERTMFTEIGQIVGTLEYMAPEQAELNNLDIDTRADIYSLGVLLYELLTGSPPFTAKQLRSAAFTEMLRMIREVEPPKPSTKLSSSQELPSIAANRKLEPKRLTKLIAGELDWIVMKCLEKERVRRYETANGLAMDLQRYLADEPVAAGPPSASYRLRKFIRRNKRGLATAVVLGVMFLAAVGAVAGTLGWAARDRSARRTITTEKVQLALHDAETLGDRALTFVDDNPYQWESTLAQALAALHQAEGLAEPERNALDLALLERLARLKARLESDEQDRLFVTRFEEIRLDAAEVDVTKDPGSPFLYVYSSHVHTNVEFKEQPSKIRDLFQHHGIALGTASPAEVVAYLNKRPESIQRHMVTALLIWHFHGPADAFEERKWCEQVINAVSSLDADPWRQRVLQAAAGREWKTLENLAREVKLERQVPALLLFIARALPEELQTIRLALLQKTQHAYPGDFWANFDYAWTLATAEPPRWAEAVTHYTAALALRPRRQGIHNNLGTALQGKGDLDGAIAEYRRAIALDPKGAGAHNNLGNAFKQKGDPDSAITEYRLAIAADPERAAAHNNLGNFLKERGDLDGAIAEYRLAIAVDPNSGGAHNNLGDALKNKGDLDGALSEYSLATALNPKDGPAWFRHSLLCLIKGDQKRFRRDCEWLLERYGETQDPDWAGFLAWHCKLIPDAVPEPAHLVGLAEKAAARHPNSYFHLSNLGGALYRAGRYQEAIQRLEEASKAAGGNDDVFGWIWLAMAHRRLGQASEAQRWFERALRWMVQPAHKTPNILWSMELELQILCREAEGLWRNAIVLNPNNDNAHADLADVLRAKGDLPGARTAYHRAAELKPDDPYRWYCLAQSHLTGGDRDEYRRVCAEMFKRFATTNDPGIAGRVLGTCLPVGDSLADMAQLLPLGKLASDGGNSRAFGAALYRAGKYQAAIPRLEKGQARAWDHLFLAMAHHHLGHAEKARDYLERAAKQLNPNGYPWPESVESEELYREAEALIKVAGKDQPKEKSNGR